MNLTKYELKKMLKTPVTAIAIVVILLLNLYILLLGSQNPGDCYKAQLPPLQTNIKQLQQNGAYFAGEINDAWYAKYFAEAEAVRNDPANFVSEAEKELVLQELRLRLNEEAIAEMGDVIYLKEELLTLNEYNKYEDMEFSAKYYERANRLGLFLAEDYRERFPGKKGETLAAKTEAMYGYLAEDYTAHYNYDWGYHKLRNMHATYPYTIGLLTLIALAPLFAAEYGAIYPGG